MFSLGTAPFSPTSSWNTPIGTGATYTSLNWPASSGFNYGVNWSSYAPAIYIASASDPLVQVSYPPGWGYPGGTIGVHMPLGATGAAGTDGEILVIDGDVVHNFWQLNRTSATSATASAYGAENIVTGDGWGSKSPFLSAGVTASGASEMAGLLVKAETDTGQINHALQLVVDSRLAQSGFTGSAISGDGGSATGIVQEGAHLGIAPGTPMPAGLSPLGQEVFRAMQQYGAYVVDVAGGTTQLRAQANAYDDATILALQHDMGSITPLLQKVSGGSGAPPSQPPPPPQPTLLSSIAASGDGITNGSGNLSAGTVHLTLSFSKPVNVSGTPTLSLNNNAGASYVSGSGTSGLVFDYTVGAGQTTSDLAVTAFNLSGVKDLAGNSINLTGAPTNPPGTLAIVAPPTPAALSSIATNGDGITNGNGNLSSGTVHLALTFSKPVNVSGTPTLTLNDNSTASYVSGSGSNSLVFDHTIAAGQNTLDLAVTGFNLSGVKDLAGNSLNLTGAPTNPGGTLAIDTTPPKLVSIAATGSGITGGNGNLDSGTVRLTLTSSEPLTVNGTPTLKLNNNGTANYVSGSGSNSLAFDYTVGAGQDTPDLTVGAFNFSGVKDLAGNSIDLTNAPTNPPGTLAIATTTPVPPPDVPPVTPPETPPVTPPVTTPPDTPPVTASPPPTVLDVTTAPSSSRSGTISLKMSENVTVTGTPALLLDTGGTATYKSGSGSDTLTFAYSSPWYRRGSTPHVNGVVLPSSSSITDNSGNAADLSDAGTTTATSWGRFSITGTSELELFGASAKSVSFASGGNGELKLDDSSEFAGRISGFGNGDTLDLRDIAFGSNTTLAYQTNRTNTGGTLTVSDGESTAKLALLGQYTASSFAVSAGASGGTAVHEAPSILSATLATSSRHPSFRGHSH